MPSSFGDDCTTKYGKGVRDSIHVVELAKGDLKELIKLNLKPGLVTYNLGTGCGYSVMEMNAAFESASGQSISYKIVARRVGEIAECWVDSANAKVELNWQADL